MEIEIFPKCGLVPLITIYLSSILQQLNVEKNPIIDRVLCILEYSHLDDGICSNQNLVGKTKGI
jgi:hypothetical protein